MICPRRLRGVRFHKLVIYRGAIGYVFTTDNRILCLASKLDISHVYCYGIASVGYPPRAGIA